MFQYETSLEVLAYNWFHIFSYYMVTESRNMVVGLLARFSKSRLPLVVYQRTLTR